MGVFIIKEETKEKSLDTIFVCITEIFNRTKFEIFVITNTMLVITNNTS